MWLEYWLYFIGALALFAWLIVWWGTRR